MVSIHKMSLIKDVINMKKNIAKMMVISVIMLFLLSSIVNAKIKRNDLYICYDNNIEETYYINGINFYDCIPNPSSDQLIPPDTLHLSPGYDEHDARWFINICCSEHGIVEGSLDFGVLHYTLYQPASVYIYDYANGQWDLIDKTMGDPEKPEWVWWWASSNGGLPNPDSNYINNKDEVKIRIYAKDEFNHGEDTKIKRIAVKFKDKEKVFDHHTSPYSGTKESGKYNFDASSDFKKLTRIKVLLKPLNDDPNIGSSGELKLAVRSDDGVLLTPNNYFSCDVFFNDGAYPGEPQWCEIDVGDIQLIPGETYTVEAEIFSGGPFEWCYSGSGNNKKFCYMNFGEEDCDDINPSISFHPSQSNGLNFGTVTKDRGTSFKTLTIYCRGDKGSGFTWSVQSNNNWISVSPPDGIVYNPHPSSKSYDDVEITVDMSNLDASKQGVSHSGSITVKTNSFSDINIPVTITVQKTKSLERYGNLLEIIRLRLPIINEILELIS